MKIAVVGGYGVFGGRLCELLRRDGHTVLVAGRNLRKAQRLARRLDADALAVDLRGDLSPLAAAAPDVVVDAAGPFQSEAGAAARDGPPPLTAFCVARGIGYIDLSDDAAFTERVAALDAAARAAGCFALSGASSVPGLSSAAVADLAAGLESVEAIESAILPGNRAPRGRSVIAGILRRLGRDMQVWRGGRWRRERCWSDPRAYTLDAGLRRRAWAIDVPDQALFPAHFAARSVTFRAGLELGIMNRAVGLLGGLRRLGIDPGGRIIVGLAHAVSTLLLPFGSDRGGMAVIVRGRRNGETVARTWRLVAEAGHGPYVPVALVRALLRDAGAIPPGARPCLAEIPLAAIVDAMDDLDIRTEVSDAPAPPLFQAILGAAWAGLPPAVRRLHEVHDVESFSGAASVVRGRGPAARLAGLLFRFPAAGTEIPVQVTKRRTGRGETWRRDFAGRRFRSHLSRLGDGRCRERFGVFAYELGLQADGESLRFPVTRGLVLGIPLPRWLLPGSEASESVEGGVFRFDVRLTAPLTGALLVHYRGMLTPDGETP